MLDASLIESHWAWEPSHFAFSDNAVSDDSRNEPLHYSSASFRVMMEHSPEAIVIFDADTNRFVDANTNAAKLFKLSREALLKVGPVEMSPAFQPDNRPSAVAVRDWIEQALLGNSPVFNWLHQDSRRSRIYCEVSLTRLPVDRNLVFARILNLTEHRRVDSARLYSEFEQEMAEQTAEMNQTEAILQNVADAIMFADQDRRIVYVNPAWEKLTGHSASEAVHHQAFFSEGGDTPPSTLQAMWQVVTAGKTWRGVLQGRRADNASYDVELSITPIQDEDGLISRFVSIEHDVTEARKLENLKTLRTSRCGCI